MNTFLGWRMVAFAIAIDFFAVGFAFQTYPVIQLYLEKELNLSRFVTTLTITYIHDLFCCFLSNSWKTIRQILCEKDNCMGRFHLLHKFDFSLFYD